MAATGVPVVFIHGLWLHASAWQPWLELFTARGYRPLAPGWPGEPGTVEEARAAADRVADHGIDAVTDHFRALIDTLDDPPVLIGHSFGGMIVEKLLGLGVGRAAIAIDAAPIKGVLPVPLSALRSAYPVLGNPANVHRAASLTAEQFRYAFGNALDQEESDALFERWTIPSPGRPLFEAATANFRAHSPAEVDTANPDRGPLLLVMGGRDHTVPEAVTRSTAKQYRHSAAETDVVELADRGHSLTVDHGWREVADLCLDWLADHGM